MVSNSFIPIYKWMQIVVFGGTDGPTLLHGEKDVSSNSGAEESNRDE